MISGGTKRSVLRPAALMMRPKSSAARHEVGGLVRFAHRQAQHQAVAARRLEDRPASSVRDRAQFVAQQRADGLDVRVEIEHVADREVLERGRGRDGRSAEGRAVVAGAQAVAASPRTISAPIGKPFASDLASVNASGVTS